MFSLQKLPVSNKNIDKVHNSNKQMSREVLKVQFIPRRVVQNRPFNIIIIISIIIKEPFKFYFLSVPSPIMALPCQSLRHWVHALCQHLSELFKMIHGFFWLIKWICQNWFMDFSRLLHQSVKIVFLYFFTWICQNQYVDFSMLVHGFVKIVTWISLLYYMDLSKLIHGFLFVGTWICKD